MVVKPPKEAVEEGIQKWSNALIGQFLDKPLPFYVVKRVVDHLWAAQRSDRYTPPAQLVHSQQAQGSGT